MVWWMARSSAAWRGGQMVRQCSLPFPRNKDGLVANGSSESNMGWAETKGFFIKLLF